jgi:hypothetical protein
VATKKKTYTDSGLKSVTPLRATPTIPEPSAPPPGFYDPALDAQGRASDRGLEQLLQDLGKGGTRAEDQRTIDKGQVNQTADWSLADLLTGKNREGEDYGTATGRLGEDHATNLASILRNYSRLGQSQAGAAVSQGLLGGSTFAKAKAARDENQGLDTTAENTQFGRQGADLLSQHNRFGEDYTTQTGRVGTQRDQQLGDIERLFGYGVVDRADQGQRATNENTFFHQDLGGQRLYQAGQAGWTAPAPPAQPFTVTASGAQQTTSGAQPAAKKRKLGYVNTSFRG